jgi:hypothetical protein
LAGSSNDGYADNLRFVLGNASVASSTTLTPDTTIEDPPVVTVKGKKATVLMQKFSKVSLTNTSGRFARALASRAKAKPKKVEIMYSATISLLGSTSKKDIKTKTSKRNQITFSGLKPGDYTATYRVKAVQGKKTRIQTDPSPAQTFTIQ